MTAGSEGHVECPEREPADDDIRFSRSRMVSAPDGNPNLGRTERLLPILGIKETAKTAIPPPALSGAPNQTHHSDPGIGAAEKQNQPF